MKPSVAAALIAADAAFAAPSGAARAEPVASDSSTATYRIVHGLIESAGMESSAFGTHSLRRTKAAQIYRKTGKPRAVQLLLGHSKIESTVRYLGIEVDDALAPARQIHVGRICALALL